jgi:hypothetical protein
VVAAAIIDGLLQLDLDYPSVSPDQAEGLREARAELLAETPPAMKRGKGSRGAKKNGKEPRRKK